jgi:hypothetical protein
VSRRSKPGAAQAALTLANITGDECRAVGIDPQAITNNDVVRFARLILNREPEAVCIHLLLLNPFTDSEPLGLLT